MSRMCTFHELAIQYARKQPGMADSLTEDAPITKVAKWIEASHSTHNVAEILVDIQGAAFANFDAPLPQMSTSTKLDRTDLMLIAGAMKVPTMRALHMGGPEKYFADRQDRILRDAGMKIEKQLVNENWLKGARESKNLKDAGAPGQGWFILGVRFDDILNVGVYDPKQFEQGTFLKISVPNNGAEHELHGPNYNGVYGYEILYRGIFGWQLFEPRRTCAAIVNIDETHAPTPAMIDDMLADIRAMPGSTYIFCSPKAKIHALDIHKMEKIHLVNSDTDVKTKVETWSGIPIITSYNIMDKRSHMSV